ncbi:Penicillin-binding protein 1A [Syntrophomonas zehnderi OL-4]|uniref:Penicillin-binding protein 1A n=1 Tax=Syntrophomonas zehnderi OL-4 TaxID=690567 RepID=A0A0E4C8L1_9FIRM|nr:PBP1A family penicillin-binding protein [Syntrophomonas zehnderi]CFX55603.1 Penicillin-binding protein 1A [Syntrophomonas zehnderi OL-4]
MEREQKPDSKPAQIKKERKGWQILISVIALVVLGSLVGTLAFVAADLPAWSEEQLTGANATLLFDDEGQVFYRLHAEEDRTAITLDKVPDDLIQAFIATEDQAFYEHHGINFKGIARAVISNIQTRDLTGQGASTITQQLARNAFLSSDKTWYRKAREALLAFRLEANYSKDEILGLYLNKIYFGAGAYGVQAAANTYFGKDISGLTLPESALLAGLVQSPSTYDPFLNFDAAKARQKIVLNSMVKCNFISQAQADEAWAEQIHLVKGQNSIERYGFFVDAVIEEALQKLKQNGIENPDYAIYRNGLKIYTTMDADLQLHGEEYFKDPAKFPSETKEGQPIQVGMAVIDHSSGEVKAIMGGREYKQQRGFNRATQAYRQPGSTIKPLTVYVPALEKGIMPYTVLDDSPISYKVGNEVWSPQNYDYTFRGLIPMRTAVQWSVNTYAVQLLDKIGVRSGFDCGKSLGLPLIDTPGKNDLGLAPLSLGGLTKGVTPLQMASAYGSIGNGGIYIKGHFITKIVDNKGLTVYEYKPAFSRAMSKETAWLMTNMLQTVVSSGTGTNARVPGVPTAGKTGTSEENRDCWFCGFTPTYCGAVWMGYDAHYTMNNQYGGNYPAKLLRSMLEKAHTGKKTASWSKPANIISVSVCSKSGLLPSGSCPEDQIITEYCVKQHTPKNTCPSHRTIVICKESGKLAGKFCPHTEVLSVVQVGSNSAEQSKIPTEKCDIHTDFNVPGLFKNTVKVCRDPIHKGKLYRANIPNASQTGGCPADHIEEIIVPPGERLPFCPLEEHQVKKQKPGDIVEQILNN